MHPKLKQLERIITQTQGKQRVIHITGGNPELGKMMRITTPKMVIVGRFYDLQVEDAEQDTMQVATPKPNANR
jgi:hypothetical protein